jgi:site-specific DNA-cytosine methylase
VNDAKPLCIDLFCGLGGWSEAFIAEGYECRGYDIEAHEYGEQKYPGTLILRDVRSIHGSEFADAAIIVASPPCQAYSYRAMPWSRAKALPPPDNTLFNECFRIQREASEAAGRYIPMVVENVRGAQKWVGPSKYNYGSFHLWGDIPALMPVPAKVTKSRHGSCKRLPGAKGGRISGWPHIVENEGIKQSGIGGPRQNGKGDAWFQNGAAAHGSKSLQRKAASAMIAKIPYPLAQHIARTYYPRPRLVEAG